MKEEQAALLTKAEASLQAAQLLMSQGHYDFSVSRAYYTMFYLAEAFLLSKDLLFAKHSATIAAFGQHFVKTGLVPKTFHHYLLDAREDRLVGDYDYRTQLGKEDADKQIAAAEAFLIFTKTYFTQGGPSDIEPKEE